MVTRLPEFTQLESSKRRIWIPRLTGIKICVFFICQAAFSENEWWALPQENILERKGNLNS